MPSKLIYEIVENDNNIEAQLNCSDEITEVLNSSDCIQKDILTKTLHNNENNKHQIKHKTNHSLKNEEGIRSFFMSNQLWIVTLLILIVVIVIALLSVWFGIVNCKSKLSGVDIVKVPGGSQGKLRKISMRYKDFFIHLVIHYIDVLSVVIRQTDLTC